MSLFKLAAFVAFLLDVIFILVHILPVLVAVLLPLGLALYVLAELTGDPKLS